MKRIVIEGYTYLPKPRSNNCNCKYSGHHGIGIFVKNELTNNIKIVPNCESESIFWIEYDNNLSSGKLFIGAVYIPHEGSVHYDQSIFENLSSDLIRLYSSYNSPNICLIGDFNSRTGILNDFLETDKLPHHSNNFDINNLDFYESKENLDLLGIETKRCNSDKKNE